MWICTSRWDSVSPKNFLVACQEILSLALISLVFYQQLGWDQRYLLINCANSPRLGRMANLLDCNIEIQNYLNRKECLVNPNEIKLNRNTCKVPNLALKLD